SSRCAVPSLGYLRRPTACRGDEAGDLDYALRVQTEQRVGAQLARDRSLGVVPQGEAGDAEERRLLLDSAGVSQRPGGAVEQAEKLDVAERLEDLEAPTGHVGARSGEGLLGPRVCWKDHW